MGGAFKTPEGLESRLNVNITIGDGDFETVIAGIKEQGGIYLPSLDGGKTFWFLPWPCAAVRICATQI